MCPSLIEIGSKTAEKNSTQTNKQTNRQTNKQTNRHYENNGHLAVNQNLVKNGLCFTKACERTDSQTNRQTYGHIVMLIEILFVPPNGGKVTNSNQIIKHTASKQQR